MSKHIKIWMYIIEYWKDKHVRMNRSVLHFFTIINLFTLKYQLQENRVKIVARSQIIIKNISTNSHLIIKM